ncbi:exported protein of unknown function [Shewanella benthica]|uniref:Uncharacterized protein n=1 Tax=Shewanella benthica TaxID=43661 RepID=A0A330M3M8_9GAMM|nr:hypothetical protein [Shewanella benthica]SQH75650.1 exported protein of unknown function [Shewanella benthica]
MRNGIYALVFGCYLLINPAIAAEIYSAVTVNNIQFNNDDAENLLIISKPTTPQTYTPENAAYIANMFRNISAIPNQQKRIQKTADLLVSLSKKYQLSTRPNWKDHVISIQYTTESAGSLHRLSKGLNRKDFDILLKQLLKEKASSNRNTAVSVSSSSDKPLLEEEDDDGNEVDEYAEWLEGYMEDMSDEFYEDKWYVRGVDIDGDGEDDEACGVYTHIDGSSDDEFLCGP